MMVSRIYINKVDYVISHSFFFHFFGGKPGGEEVGGVDRPKDYKI